MNTWVPLGAAVAAIIVLIGGTWQFGELLRASERRTERIEHQLERIEAEVRTISQRLDGAITRQEFAAWISTFRALNSTLTVPEVPR